MEVHGDRSPCGCGQPAELSRACSVGCGCGRGKKACELGAGVGVERELEVSGGGRVARGGIEGILPKFEAIELGDRGSDG